MQVISWFDPSTANAGQIEVGAADPGCKILLYNLSIYAIKIDFENGSTALLHAGEANWWKLDGSTPFLLWSQYSKLANASPAISQITGMLYRQDEEITGTYPMSLTYQLNIGNTVTTNLGSTLAIQNDGNTLTNIVEATPSGDNTSAVVLTNTGAFTLGNSTHHGSISSDNGKFTTDGNGDVAVGGTLTVTGNTTLGGSLELDNQSLIIGRDSSGNTGNIFGVDGSGNTFIQYHPTNNQFVVYNKNGIAVATFDINSMLNLVGISQSNNGDTSGTQVILEGIYGIYKIAIVKQNNYKQAGGAFQETLKNAFSFGAIWLNMGCGGLEVQNNGGGALSANQITWGNGTSAGTSAGGTGMPAFACGVIISAFNQLGDSGGYASAHTGLGIFIGV